MNLMACGRVQLRNNYENYGLVRLEEFAEKVSATKSACNVIKNKGGG